MPELKTLVQNREINIATMDTINTQIQQFLTNIRNEIQVETNLRELKVALSALSETQITEISATLPIPVIFDCLNSSNRQQILITCEILNLCLPHINSSIVCVQYQNALIRALLHPVKEVKEMALKEFIRATKEHQIFRILREEDNFLISIVDCLCDREISVGLKAATLLTDLGNTGCGLTLICRPKVISQILQNTEVDELFKVRLFQVIVNIGLDSEDRLKHMESLGLMKGIISTLKSNDNLATMAALEVISPLAATEHGFDFLARNQILKLLSEQIVSIEIFSENNHSDEYYFPGLAKFFGVIGQRCPREFMDFCPDVLRALFKGIDSNNFNIFASSLEAIGFISYSAMGKALLKEHDKSMKHTLSRCYEAITIRPYWRVRALGALANFMHMEHLYRAEETREIILGAQETDALTTKLTEEWFNHLGTNGLQLIVDFTKQPFPDVKMVSFAVLKEIADQKWGQTRIVTHSGLLNYLMDRTDELIPEGKLVKYNIVKRMVDSYTIKSVIHDKEELARLQEFVNQGPHYRPVQLQVAVEGVE